MPARQGWRTAPLKEGRRLPEVPGQVEDLWRSLNPYGDATVFESLDDEAEAPVWWTTCLELMMTCDEACAGIGFDAENPFFALVMNEYVGQALTVGNAFSRVQHGPFSLAAAAEDLLCIQAKARRRASSCAAAGSFGFIGTSKALRNPDEEAVELVVSEKGHLQLRLDATSRNTGNAGRDFRALPIAQGVDSALRVADARNEVEPGVTNGRPLFAIFCHG